ncbi:hypothetical protein CEUSTIGMA_g6923.t1 [Chlamydomonas eustigma]|uniref:NAD(P)-binding domain-containing protein n=1 Tax=Chlamydomonas eustigma TaxID=1157962 RepID=A0A250X9B6_9CHLO|nr:hypothetical protein CEUSTIGMA_g6923.t1 [Chlamydomonas eustigma]|eukprot:GAX79482.1 hypothetical protein CEUSTIGMA_g6923.t1 [Chlamydomonas eustigma]
MRCLRGQAALNRSAASRPFTYAVSSRPIRVSNVLRATPAYDLDPDNASILVCGGGGVALHVTRQLKNMGSWVWQLQRSDDRRAEIEKMMAIVAKGDAMSKADVQRVFDSIEEVDAVISTIGGTVANPVADSEGNINLIEAAAKKGVKKFILVTSIGCGETRDAPGENVYNVLKPILLEKEKAEKALQVNGDKMAFVIIRPGGLTDDTPSKAGVLTEDFSACGAISRQDVASLVVKALFSKKADGKILSAMDPARMMPGKASPAVFLP